MKDKQSPEELAMQKRIDALAASMKTSIGLEEQWQKLVYDISDLRAEENDKAWKEFRSTVEPNIDFEEARLLARKLGWRRSSLEC